MIIDNLILEKCIGKGSYGEVYITSIKGDDNRKLASKKLEREQIEGSEVIKYLKNDEVLKFFKLIFVKDLQSWNIKDISFKLFVLKFDKSIPFNL